MLTFILGFQEGELILKMPHLKAGVIEKGGQFVIRLMVGMVLHINM